MMYDYHTPVLVEEVLRFLNIQESGVYVDATLGGGGHSEQLLLHTSDQVTVIGVDADEDALTFARQTLQRFGKRVDFIHDNFSNLKKCLRDRQITSVDGVLMDLGISSRQIDNGARGFSFQRHGRLDMRMDQRQVLEGWTVVNTYEQARLADIFWKYGEERNARKIAQRIVEARSVGAIDTTEQLAEIVEKLTGKHFLQKSLARIFQAIRIEVNHELEHLQQALQEAIDLLRPGGRIVVISYHSLEDRVVKDIFKMNARTVIPSGHKLVPDLFQQANLRLLTKKPVEASGSEIAGNTRARSAKLRAAERL
jgi:16S rRNA (cytosine1402-N4)-methyltransferase